jgi:hypothetical protein
LRLKKHCTEEVHTVSKNTYFNSGILKPRCCEKRCRLLHPVHSTTVYHADALVVPEPRPLIKGLVPDRVAIVPTCPVCARGDGVPVRHDLGRCDLWDWHPSVSPCAVSLPLNQLTNTNLTDLADLPVLYLGQARRFSTSIGISIMVGRKQPSAYKMRPPGCTTRRMFLVGISCLKICGVG